MKVMLKYDVVDLYPRIPSDENLTAEEMDANYKDRIFINLVTANYTFEKDSPSFILEPNEIALGKGIVFCLDKKTFARLTGYYWDGTAYGVEKLRKYFIGKEFKMDLGILTR